MNHRTIGYSFLSGSGIEIGALHNPAKLPTHCKVCYCDAMSADDARRSFPELKDLPLVHVDYLVNLDADGLKIFDAASLDFIILNHVIEHVANPVHVLIECFRVLRDGGKLVLSAPDMRYTFDKNRKLTSIEHLWDEYEKGISEVSDEHYIDFLQAVHPEAFESEENLQTGLKIVRDRREHAHVWTSTSFQEFLTDLLKRTNIHAIPLVLHHSQEFGEFYSVWQKVSVDINNNSDLTYPKNILDITNFLISENKQDNSLLKELGIELNSYKDRLVYAEQHLKKKDDHIKNIEDIVKFHQDEAEKNSKLLLKVMKEKDDHIHDMELFLKIERDRSEELSSYITRLHQSVLWKLLTPLRWVYGFLVLKK